MALVANVAWACKCNWGNLEPREGYAEMIAAVDAVTLATAIEVKTDYSFGNWPDLGTKLTKFEPQRTWKGDFHHSFQTKIDTNCCVCGVSFEVGQTYVLFLHGPDAEGYYSTSSCARARIRHHQSMEDEILILDELTGRSQR